MKSSQDRRRLDKFIMLAYVTWPKSGWLPVWFPLYIYTFKFDSPTIMFLQCWQLVGLRNTWSWKQWLICGRTGLAGREGERLRQGECEATEGLGLREGDTEGERISPTRGEPGARGGEGGGGSLRKSWGRRASLLDLWKKLSTLLLRITVLKESERFRRCNCKDRTWEQDLGEVKTELKKTEKQLIHDMSPVTCRRCFYFLVRFYTNGLRVTESYFLHVLYVW